MAVNSKRFSLHDIFINKSITNTKDFKPKTLVKIKIQDIKLQTKLQVDIINHSDIGTIFSLQYKLSSCS